ncbi:MAG: primosomal replication protein N [Rhodocyclaceae bacterium]|nr:primosomal replication protein N [Rhodocyclaceae bacterium]
MEITGQIVELDALRHTPAGVPVLGFKLEHRSRREEAGHPREVAVELAAKAMGEMARLLAGSRLGIKIRVTGFLAQKSAKIRQPVLHVIAIEFVEGN